MGIFRDLARDKQARSVAWCVASLVVPPGATENSPALVLYCESRGRRIEQADHPVPRRARTDNDVRATVSVGPPAEGFRRGVARADRFRPVAPYAVQLATGRIRRSLGP